MRLKLILKHPAAHTALAWLAANYLRLVVRTSRLIWLTPPPPPGPVILAIWHGQLLGLPALLHRWHYPRGGALSLSSDSRDGDFATRIGAQFGFGSVRGSSHKHRMAASRAMLHAVRSGQTLLLAPDGPKGPARVAKPGAASLAARSGLPLVALSASATRAWRLKSWDGARVPKPFGRLYLAAAACPLDELATTLNHLSALTERYALGNLGGSCLSKTRQTS